MPAPSSPLAELRKMNVAKQREAGQQAEQRQADEDAAHITSNTVGQSYDLPIYLPTDNTTDGQTDTQTGKQTNPPTDRMADVPVVLPADRQAGVAVSPQAGRPTDIRARLKQIVASPMIPITLKIPAGINEYLDTYIHDHWKEKIKKQDLLKRAMLLAIYELETGKELVKLDG